MTLERPPPDLDDALRSAFAERTTVTRFLEALTGEPLVADVMSQRPVAPDPDDGLGVEAEQTVVRRLARLRGPGGTAYVDADTLFVPTRLPVRARQRLAHGSDPIGRVLAEEGLAPVQIPAVDPVLADRPDPVSQKEAETVVWRRAYRLAVGGRPVFAIREWFLRPVLDALAASSSTKGIGPSRSS